MSSSQDIDFVKEPEVSLPSNNLVYAKSNILISGKYKSTLLENQIMAYSLAHAKEFDLGSSERETIKSVIKVNELRKILGQNKGSFYQKLHNTAKSMTGRTIGMSSPDGTSFDYISVVTRATCKDGEFTIEYNGAVRDILVNLQRNYSKLNLDIQLKFKNNYAFRLYELLKQKCYYPKGSNIPKDNRFFVRMGLSELKLELGIVNAELDTVRRILLESNSPDYDRAVEHSPEQMFPDWYEFKRNVLDKAIREINAKTDITIEYNTIKNGVGGKVKSVDFTITLHSLNNEEEYSLSEEDKLDILLELRGYTNKYFSAIELRTIAEEASWSVDKVCRAYDVFVKQKNIKNPTGWMIQAIRGKYKKSSGTISKTKSAKSNSFNDFSQREYDYDELEKKLLAR